MIMELTFTGNKYTDVQHFCSEWHEPAPAQEQQRAAIMRHRALLAVWDAEHPKEAAAGKPWPRALWKQARAEIYG